MTTSQSGGWRIAATGCALSLVSLLACCTSAPAPVSDASVQAHLSTPPPPPPPPPLNPPATAEERAQPATVQNLEIVRYVGADRGAWPDYNVKPSNLSDLYTRVIVETTADGAGSLGSGGPGSDSTVQRSYALERRSALARLFSNRTIAVTTLASAEVKDPDVTTSLPLFSISHDSVRGSGEVFVTNFNSAHVQAPLFRIGPNTTFTIHLNAKMSDQQKTDVTGLVIKAVQTAVNIAAPTSSILTTLSKDDISKSSQAIDSVLGGLSSQDVTEDIELGRLVDTWTATAEIRVEGRVPWGLVYAEGDKPDSTDNIHQDKNIGTWHIKLTCPRPSVFDARDLCGLNEGRISFDITKLPALKNTIKDSVSVSKILQTNLSSGTTIQAFIQTQSAYTTFLQKLSKLPSDTKEFCASTMSALYAAGLNQFDTALVVWAMGQNMPGLVSLDPSINVKSSCATLVSADVTL